jgi:TPR repeat protein
MESAICLYTGSEVRYDLPLETIKSELDSGKQAFEKGDYKAAVRKLLPPAHKGNAVAQYYIARMCYQGLGLPENPVNAARWAQAAAERGNGDAEALLGILYTQGKGVPRDEYKAVDWFHRAAMRGNATAQSRLGLCCLRGAGTEQNCLTAYMWFHLATLHSTGHDQMCNCDLRDTFAAMNLTPAQIEEAKRLAQEWKPQKPRLLNRLHLA